MRTPQLYVDRARLDEKQPGGFDLLKGLVDVGDIVGATGTIKRTEKGELSVVTTGLQVGCDVRQYIHACMTHCKREGGGAHREG